MMAQQLVVIAAAALMLAPLAAEAQQKGERYTYRCTGTDGKKYYGSTIPTACLGQPIDQLNSRGIRVKRIDPEGDEKARLEKEAEEKRLADEAAEKREALRRNRALLATYTSVKDIDSARRRALADNQKAVTEAESRIEMLKKRRAAYDKELEFYKDGKPPAKLAEDIRATEVDIEATQGLLESKQKETANINTRYDEDRRRYIELTGRK
jgi:chromosome segregation ATPase